MCKGHGKFNQIPIDSKFPTKDFLELINNNNLLKSKDGFSNNVKKKLMKLHVMLV